MIQRISRPWLAVPVILAALVACGGGDDGDAASAPQLYDPTNIRVAGTGSTSIELAWDAANGATEYSVAVLGPARFETIVGTTASTRFRHTGLIPGSTYTYVVHSTVSNQPLATRTQAVTLPMPVADTTPPGVPAGLTIAGRSQTALWLTWTAPVDNVGGSGVRDYAVYRNGAQVARVITPSYSDLGLAGATSYSYAVIARDHAFNESAPSASLMAATDAVPPSDLSKPPLYPILETTSRAATSIALHSIGSPPSITPGVGGTANMRYRFYRDGSLLAEVDEQFSVTFIDNTAAASSAYSYQASRISGSLVESDLTEVARITSPEAFDPTPPGMVTSVMATSVGTAVVSLRWTAATDDSAGSGVRDYVVYRDGVRIATAAALQFVDNSVSPGRTYSYQIGARDQALNESVLSFALTITTAT